MDTVTVQDDRHTDWGWFYYRIVDDFGPVIKADGVAVYMVLVRHASNDARTAYPAIATIAKKLGISERQVRYTLDRLVAAGLVAIEPRLVETANGKSRQTSNLYRLLPLPAAPPANIAPPAPIAVDPLQILHPPPANIAAELDSVNDTQKERESDAPAPVAVGDISRHNGHNSNVSSPGKQMSARPVAAEDAPPVVVTIPAGTPVNRRPDAPPVRAVPKPDKPAEALSKWKPDEGLHIWWAEQCVDAGLAVSAIDLRNETAKWRESEGAQTLKPGQYARYWRMWMLRAIDRWREKQATVPQGKAPPRRRSVEEVDL